MRFANRLCSWIWKNWIPAPRLREDKLRGNDSEAQELIPVGII